MTNESIHSLMYVMDGFLNKKRAQTDNLTTDVLQEFILSADPSIDLKKYNNLRDLKKDTVAHDKIRNNAYAVFDNNMELYKTVIDGLKELEAGTSNIAKLSGMDINDSATLTKENIAKAASFATMFAYLGLLNGTYSSPLEYVGLERLAQQQ